MMKSPTFDDVHDGFSDPEVVRGARVEEVAGYFAMRCTVVSHLLSVVLTE